MSAPVEFTYRREGSRGFRETLEAVEGAVRSHGLCVVRRHDLQATLAAKGFDIQPLVVLDVVAGDDDEHPCKLHVYAEGEIVWVTAIRPTVLWNVIEPEAAPRAEGDEVAMVAIVDDAVR
ncbi:MAG: DUF302 domain-containing protein [Actinomycetota bacterium]|nr:DUF302 domain-containing protein [Actinomycetota bacterium]